MKSFEEHLRGAKAHNREDKIWLVTCFSGKMAKLCAKYGFPDDEDMFVYLIEHESRWVTIIFVIFIVLRFSNIFFSVDGSKLLVASSKTKTCGFFSRALAIANRCL